MVDRFERFTYAIAETSRCWHKIASEEMEKYGLKGPHAVYLITIYRHPDGITAAKLCDLCSKDKSDVSRSMSLLMKKGLVTKVSGNQNSYRALLKLTAEGILAAEHVRERVGVAVEIAGNGISEEHRKIFYETLEQITINLQSISKEGLPK